MYSNIIEIFKEGRRLVYNFMGMIWWHPIIFVLSILFKRWFQWVHTPVEYL